MKLRICSCETQIPDIDRNGVNKQNTHQTLTGKG